MNKKMRYFARDIGFEADDLLCVGFCKDQDNPKSNEGLLLMRENGGDEDDEIYVEIPPERFTTCGGIKTAVLSRSRFVIEFNRDAMNDLDGIVSMDISFDLHDEDFSAVREILGGIFEGHDGYSEVEGKPSHGPDGPAPAGPSRRG